MHASAHTHTHTHDAHTHARTHTHACARTALRRQHRSVGGSLASAAELCFGPIRPEPSRADPAQLELSKASAYGYVHRRMHWWEFVHVCACTFSQAASTAEHTEWNDGAVRLTSADSRIKRIIFNPCRIIPPSPRLVPDGG
eukprot:GHVU01000465.1.p2 GENE.GHVU01000465.1~~GHVU01000465.1.p2  ORF type:complete len:141 (+),score=6.00 GHVU01000465.1:43-465(+)